MLPPRGWIYMLVPVIGLGLGEARADQKMDWTPYLEPANSRPTPKATPSAEVAPTVAAPKKTAKAKSAPKKKPAAAAQKPKRKAQPARRK